MEKDKCRHRGMCDYRENENICSFDGHCGAKEKTPEPKDLVEVVRCKDCKHYKDASTGWCDIHSDFLDHLNADWRMFNANDYCSLGEVRWKLGNKIKERGRNED